MASALMPHYITAAIGRLPVEKVTAPGFAGPVDWGQQHFI